MLSFLNLPPATLSSVLAAASDDDRRAIVMASMRSKLPEARAAEDAALGRAAVQRQRAVKSKALELAGGTFADRLARASPVHEALRFAGVPSDPIAVSDIEAALAATAYTDSIRTAEGKPLSTAESTAREKVRAELRAGRYLDSGSLHVLFWG